MGTYYVIKCELLGSGNVEVVVDHTTRHNLEVAESSTLAGGDHDLYVYELAQAILDAVRKGDTSDHPALRYLRDGLLGDFVAALPHNLLQERQDADLDVQFGFSVDKVATHYGIGPTLLADSLAVYLTMGELVAEGDTMWEKLPRGE